MRLKILLPVFLAISIASTSAVQAQKLSTNKDALMKRLDGFKEEVEQLRTKWNIPGLAVGIVTDSLVVWSKGFGVRNIKTEEPVTKETLFGIGSITKSFTAAGLGILNDQDKIEWDTPIREYISSFKMYDHFSTEEMTTTDLLTHRTGLPRHDMLWYATDYSREDIARRLRYLKPTASFRTKYQYSNVMYIMAGYLSGQVSESSWEEVTLEQIIKPLNLTHTILSTSRIQDMKNYARPYKGTPDTTIETSLYHFAAASPAGGIHSSVSDMNTWLQLFLNDGNYRGAQIIDSTTVAELTQPRIFTGYPPSFVENYGSSSFYAFGWTVITHRGNRLLIHTGNIDGYLSLVGMLPDQEVGWVILANKHSDPNPVHSIIMFELMDRILDKDTPDWNQKITNLINWSPEKNNTSQTKPTKSGKHSSPPPSHSLEDYIGTYTHPGYGTFDVTMEGDNLVAHFGTINSTLYHKKYDLFQFSYMMVGNEKTMNAQFKMDMNGDIVEVAVPMELAEPIVFTRE